MEEYPYANATNRIKELFSKIKGTGVPGSINNEWLKTIGFTSSNDRKLLRILKFISFVDGSGKPTESWRKYRGSEEREVLAEAIRTGYRELFSFLTNANKANRIDLDNFFTTKTNLGKETVARITNTFLTLCELADFTSPESGIILAETGKVLAVEKSPETLKSPGMTVNINLQIALPETSDEAIYEKIFQAIKKHLMS
jgi:hypothetical protein